MTKRREIFLSSLILAGFLATATAFWERGRDPLDRLIRAKRSWSSAAKLVAGDAFELMGLDSAIFGDKYKCTQDGLMEVDKISELPGQPEGVNFDQYGGYITVEQNHGRALFYYFVESPQDASRKPLVLWLNGGPGCSSLGAGAMMELGPFRVNSDGKTLSSNPYAWNQEANVLFVESPAGVGFSYSNVTSDYDQSGDVKTAEDSYIFLVNWLERFPHYKGRDFYIAGESYAGHYVPQLAQTILHSKNISNQTVINLRAIAIGNPWIDDETGLQGQFDFLWSRALISDDTYEGVRQNCNFSSKVDSTACDDFKDEAYTQVHRLDAYNIYAPLCSSSSAASRAAARFDPCSKNYVYFYLNRPEVQKALHANVTALPKPWESCNFDINGAWKDSPDSILPVIQELMQSGLPVWIYSGDTDSRVPVTSSKLSVNKIRPTIDTAWFPWYADREVGGYAVGYRNLTLVTIRECGHFVPSYQPARALTLFASFLQGKLPPNSNS